MLLAPTTGGIRWTTPWTNGTLQLNTAPGTRFSAFFTGGQPHKNTITVNSAQGIQALTIPTVVSARRAESSESRTRDAAAFPGAGSCDACRGVTRNLTAARGAPWPIRLGS